MLEPASEPMSEPAFEPVSTMPPSSGCTGSVFLLPHATAIAAAMMMLERMAAVRMARILHQHRARGRW